MKTMCFLILFLLLSCGIDKGETYNYTIKNESGVDIKIIGYVRFDRFIINIKNEQQYTQVYEDGLPPRGYHFKYLFGSSNGNDAADSIRIVYNTIKFTVFDFDNLSSERNPLGPNHNDGGVEAIYTITQQDYETATPIAFENLLGSVWRCTAGAGLQDGVRYNELRFVSDTTVEGWALTTEDPTPEHLFTATYTIANQTITISDGEDDFFVATLNETQDLVTNIDDDGECVYQR